MPESPEPVELAELTAELTSEKESGSFVQMVLTRRDKLRRLLLPDLAARLNTVGSHVVCGRPNCGARLATVNHCSEEEAARIRKEAKASDPEGDVNIIDHIAFPPGWAPREDGIWELSSHGQNRKTRANRARSYSGLGHELPESMRMGLKSKLRRYPLGDGVIRGNIVMDSHFDPLPVAAICPERSCGMANAIYPEIVGVNVLVRIPAQPG